MKEILENNFEQVYKEYKDYEQFFAPKRKTVEERRTDIAKFVNDNQDNQQQIIDKVFEEGTKYMFHEADIRALKAKLFYTYKAVEGALDIPLEVRKEILSFEIEPQFYVIQNSAEKEIQTETINAIKEGIRKDFDLVVKEALKML